MTGQLTEEKKAYKSKHHRSGSKIFRMAIMVMWASSKCKMRSAVVSSLI